MCGIAGICAIEAGRDIDLTALTRMVGAVRHRGPESTGVYIDDRIGLGHARLRIIDLESGAQPIHNEDGTLWIVYNGEVFNYVELRAELEGRGHRFYTNSDTEVVLHLYEQEGLGCLDRLNGQFAFAIWNRRAGELFLARDRVGILPLHYTLAGGKLLFASEVKAIFAVSEVSRAMDPRSIDQVFTFWTVLPGNTAFLGIRELPPGHYLRVARGELLVRQYYALPVYGRGELSDAPLDVLCEQAGELLRDAVRIRLRADVPVGCYLSGGLDSSGLAAMVARRSDVPLKTFGIRFDQDAYDEARHQKAMVSFLGTSHHEVQATADRIGRSFPQALWHCEKPLLRTATVPLYMLSDEVAANGIKVVLTGEGADEVFGGYNLFKEAKVRRFLSRQPGSSLRAALFGKLYHYVFSDPRAKRFLPSFFTQGLDQVDDPLFSHLLRWENTSRIKTFFSSDLKAAVKLEESYEVVRASLPPRYAELDVVGKAQYLEMSIFMSNYLLCSQGDRMAMAHSVEIRVPYLDHRVIDFMAKVPSRWKLLGMNEKHLLKKVFRTLLPAEVVAREKQPYRAPIVCCLLNGPAREGTYEMLGRQAIDSAGLFDAAKVSRLLQKLETSAHPTELDSMALAGILSAQIIHKQFVADPPVSSVGDDVPALFIDKRSHPAGIRIDVHSPHQRSLRKV
ncbi:MAG: asparagine synthase (glutamine-hydrolyzing) [Phycisphaerales bacterium]